MNIRRVTKVSLLAIAFVWAGYSISSDAFALGGGTGNFSASSGVTAKSSIDDTQSVENAYAGLPTGVAKSVQSVVAVQRITSTSATNNAVVASGVILNNHQVLTAGHATDSNGAMICARTTVEAPGYLTAAAASSNPVIEASAMHSTTADLAILSVDANQNYKNLPAMAVATSLPAVGETVYFINYQPQADGTIRSPLSRTTGDPVIFSGTVVGRDSQGIQIAAGGGTSYGHGQTETLLRKGASGGAIVNKNGELVGLSVSSDSLDANRTPAYIGTNFGVSMPQGLYQIVNAQTLSSQLLTKLQTTMAACN